MENSPLGHAQASSGWQQLRHRRFVAFWISIVLLVLAMHLGMVGALLCGMLVYSVVHLLGARLALGRLGTDRARWLALTLVGALVVLALVMMGVGVSVLLKDGAGFHDLLAQMGTIVGSTRQWLPSGLAERIPPDADLFNQAGHWLSEHAAELGQLGLGAFRSLGMGLVGMLLGAMIAISADSQARRHGPVGRLFIEQLEAFRQVFWRIASAQVRISAINTTLTAIYLLVVLPLAGVHLPLTKTLVIVTFLCGLVPVVGNLISNTAITVISLGYSFDVAIASLVFLVLVHKLEYFINARIVGDAINASAWEILLAIIILEHSFGLPGVVLAPIVYAWFKQEWQRWDPPTNEARKSRQRRRSRGGGKAGGRGENAPAAES